LSLCSGFSEVNRTCHYTSPPWLISCSSIASSVRAFPRP
jgi:hypothetical protein